MSNFIKDLDSILSSNDNVQKELNLELNNKILTKAIDAMLPYPGTIDLNFNSNSNFYINNIVIFDIEFYTLINPGISQFGFIACDDTNKIANLVREITMLILERTHTGEHYYWTIKKLIFFNINNEFLYKTLYFIRQNYAKFSKNLLSKDSLVIRGPYLRMLSKYFMTINVEEYNSELESKLQNNQIKNKEQFINKLRKIVNENINSENYLGYSDHRYYYTDHDLMKYHDAVMSTYINNSDVKNRELSALQTLNIFKLFESYKKKICIVYKGDSDIKAINNTYRLFDWIDRYNYDSKIGRFLSSAFSYDVNNKLEIIFPNTYDLAYFNGMSHVLYKSAKLSVTCQNMISSNFYKRMIKNNQDIGMKSIKYLVSMLDNGRAHDPNYDVISTLIVVIIINLSIISVFTE